MKRRTLLYAFTAFGFIGGLSAWLTALLTRHQPRRIYVDLSAKTTGEGEWGGLTNPVPSVSTAMIIAKEGDLILIKNSASITALTVDRISKTT